MIDEDEKDQRLAERQDQIMRLIEANQRLSDSEELLRVQLAGCLAAAEGHIQDPVTKGMYGWSVAYQAVLECRQELERLRKER